MHVQRDLGTEVACQVVGEVDCMAIPRVNLVDEFAVAGADVENCRVERNETPLEIPTYFTPDDSATRVVWQSRLEIPVLARHLAAIRRFHCRNCSARRSAERLQRAA